MEYRKCTQLFTLTCWELIYMLILMSPASRSTLSRCQRSDTLIPFLKLWTLPCLNRCVHVNRRGKIALKFYVRFKTITLPYPLLESRHNQLKPVAYRGGVWGVQPPPNSEGPLKSCQTQPDCEKLLNMAEFRMPANQDVRKKGNKILKLPRFAIVLH